MSRDRLGVALVGSGMAAPPHAAALLDLSDRIEVRGVYARNQDQCRQFAEKYGFPVAENPDAIVADTDVDAVILITPPNARTEYVARFAAAGKHILCEKPLERTTQNAQSIVDACNAAGIKLGVVFQHRYREASLMLKRLLSGNRFGAIGMVRIEVPWWRPQDYYDVPGRGTFARDGGGVLISQAIHTLDLAMHLAGPVAAVQAMTATTRFHKMESEDFAVAGLQFVAGMPGSLVATTAAFPGSAESIEIHCDEAVATLCSGILTVHWRDGRVEEYGETANTGGGADPMDFPHSWHRDLMLGFFDAIERGMRPPVSGADALRVQMLIDGIARASQTGSRETVEQPA